MYYMNVVQGNFSFLFNYVKPTYFIITKFKAKRIDKIWNLSRKSDILKFSKGKSDHKKKESLVIEPILYPIPTLVEEIKNMQVSFMEKTNALQYMLLHLERNQICCRG